MQSQPIEFRRRLPYNRVKRGVQDMLHEVACNCCSTESFTVVFDAGEAQVHRIVRCNRCGLLYSSPRGGALETCNPDSPSSEGKDNWWVAPRMAKEKLQVRDYNQTREFLNKLYPGRGRLLEIGSGFGHLLARFRDDGWEVHGIDPYPDACRIARETFSVDARCEFFQNASLEDNSFDVVLMNHVIEHLDDPLGALRQCYRILKPGGCLLMETPRYDSLMFRLLGRRERSISCDDHLYFFTVQSLRSLYEKAGFQNMETWFTGRTMTIDRLLWNLTVMLKNERARRAVTTFSKHLHLDQARMYVNAHDMQRVAVQKPLD